ncbi:MAG: hypothetical protein SFX72_18305 [Isosphaeraceae bacterium]|nr:hypothetical protein [Isosphaeraceae bacterium]
MSATRSIRLWFLTLCFCTLGALRVEASEFYYVMIFGSQSQPKRLELSHTWATFVKAVGEGTDPDSYTLEAHTISWLPASLDVKIMRLRPETGVNLDHAQTMAFVTGQGQGVTMWGPFIVNAQIWNRSLEVRSLIESGRVSYRAISTARNLFISDCIHAVASVDPELGRRHYPLIRIGKPASRYVARQIVLRSVFDQSAFDNSWLIPRLGIDRDPITIVPPCRIPEIPCFLCMIPE